MDKRYFIVAGAFIAQAVIIGCVFAYGVYFAELEKEFGWSRTQLSLATSLGFFSMGLMAALAGQMSDRFGPRKVISVAALCTSSAYVLLYFLSSPWQLFLIYGTLVGVGLAIHDVVTLSTIAKWFPRRRGVMSGIVKVGTACGQMVVPLIAVWLISSVGWRQSFLVLGVGAGFLLMLSAWLMGSKPLDTTTATAASAAHGVSFKDAIKMKSLWMLCALQFFFFASLTTIPTHIVPHAMDSGLSVTAAATLLTVVAFSSIFGRMLFGVTFDRLGGRRSYIFCLLLLFVSLSSLLVIDAAQLLFLFAIAYGFTHGGLFTVVSPTVAEYFGMREHGKIFGFIVFFGTISGAVMPVLTGMIFDTRSSYFSAFALLCAMTATALLLAIVLRKSDTANVTANLTD